MIPDYKHLYVRLYFQVDRTIDFLASVPLDADPDQLRSALEEAARVLSATKAECDTIYMEAMHSHE